jgi:hypothetical protein
VLAYLMVVLAVGGADRPIGLRPVVEVSGEAVTLADVVESGDLPPEIRARAPAVVLARLTPGAALQVSPRRLMARARAQIPALGRWTVSDGPPVLLRRRLAAGRPDQGAQANCVRVLRPIAGGSFLEADALEPVACGKAPVLSATRFDRPTGLVRASQALREGEVIVAPPKAVLARYAPGQAFTLSAAVGPVRIERPVEAIRPAADGAAVAVRDSDGKIHVLTAKEETR